MENQHQGNESNSHVIILDIDGSTIFNGRRTVRNVTNDGIVKSGVVSVKGRQFKVIHNNWKWTGTWPPA
jgi:hypothetical protein